MRKTSTIFSGRTTPEPAPAVAVREYLLGSDDRMVVVWNNGSWTFSGLGCTTGGVPVVAEIAADCMDGLLRDIVQSVLVAGVDREVDGCTNEEFLHRLLGDSSYARTDRYYAWMADCTNPELHLPTTPGLLDVVRNVGEKRGLNRNQIRLLMTRVFDTHIHERAICVGPMAA